MRWLLASACLVATSLSLGGPSVAHAAGPELSDGPQQGPARELWVEAHTLFQGGDYLAAADRFDRAYELERSPLLGLWVARSLTRAGRWVDALDRYREIAEQPLASDAVARDWAARRDAKLERQQLAPRVPNLIVLLEGAPRTEVTIEVNGNLLPSEFIGTPRAVDPGSLRVSGAHGKQQAEEALEIAEGETKTVRLSFVAPPAPVELRSVEPKPDDPGQAQRVGAFVAVGVGGAVLLTGGVFAALAASDEGRLLRDCPMSRCEPRFRSTIDAYESKKTIATVGLWSGAALVASGVALYLTLPARPRTSRVGAYFAGQQLGVWGAF
ncbi:MAG: hypothetical protein QM756_00165 [Polyangiaceae bacterium]